MEIASKYPRIDEITVKNAGKFESGQICYDKITLVNVTGNVGLASKNDDSKFV